MIDAFNLVGYGRVMKIWIKLIIASIFGLVIGLVLPPNSIKITSVFDTINEFVLAFGQYILIPLLLFSIPIAVFEMYSERKLVRTTFFSILFSILFVVCATLIGVCVPIIFMPQRIPLVVEAAKLPLIPEWKEILLSLFPTNAFQVILFSNNILLPLIILCFALGLAFCHDKVLSRPIITFFDSLSRIIYQINSLFVEIIALLIIPLSAGIFYSQRNVFSSSVYTSLLVVILAETIFTGFIIYPVIIYFFGGKKNPFARIYALMAPMITAAVSGQVMFSAGMQLRHIKENLGIKRRSGTIVVPLVYIFGKAGTALITATTFIAVLSSYSNIGLSLSSILWVLLTVPLIMILISAAPLAGPASAVMALCSMYGRGFESGYLLLVPIAIPLAACAATIDILSAGVIAIIISEKNNDQIERDFIHYI